MERPRVSNALGERQRIPLDRTLCVASITQPEQTWKPGVRLGIGTHTRTFGRRVVTCAVKPAAVKDKENQQRYDKKARKKKQNKKAKKRRRVAYLLGPG